MSHRPLLSYIVLSYDYEDYISTTIQSILEQSVQDFEIVVVDDASHDASVEVVRGFADPRIRLLVNEQNLGGAASYNRGVEAARGEWLVNVDADDWIAPAKAEVQLAIVAADPDIDIVGTWACIIDAQGQPHPQASEIYALVNQPLELGRVENWIGQNLLVRSSTMVRRAIHMRVGLDDPSMVRAPDYELWTRALRAGCRFHVVPQQLTYLRQHARGVTHGDSVGSLLETSYAMLRNLVPYVEARALLPSYSRIVTWTTHHPSLSSLRPIEAHRLIGSLLTTPRVNDFASFRALLAADDTDPILALMGRRILALDSAGREECARLEAALAEEAAGSRKIAEARDWHAAQSARWEALAITAGASTPRRRFWRLPGLR